MNIDKSVMNFLGRINNLFPLWIPISLMRSFQRHQKSETGVLVAPKMDVCPTKKLKTKNISAIFSLFNNKITILVFPSADEDTSTKHVLAVLNVMTPQVHMTIIGT